MVAFVREDGGWAAAGWRGKEVRDRLPDGIWRDLLKEAEETLRRHHPSRAILSLSDKLLSWFRKGVAPGAKGGRGLSPGGLAGIVLGGLYLVIRVLREIKLRQKRGII